MHEIHIRRIKKVLYEKFESLIDLNDVEDRSETDRENHFLTRSLAALALVNAANIDKEKAANSIVDGYCDNGIDAICFSEDARTLYAVQSKWSSSGRKGLDVGSVEKYISGVNDYLSGKFERFNEKFNSQRETLEMVLDSADVTFSLIIVYTSVQPLSEQIELKLNDFIKNINAAGDIVSYKTYNQKDIYSAISGNLENTSINIDVTLYEWGQIKEPYQAFYGQVFAEEIARWYKEHNSHLFARNLRKFKGDTEVNKAMKLTLIEEPGKFWYFNNGITVLCNSINKKPIGGATRDASQFSCEGISVVNGAQTVGNIANSVSQGFQKAKDAKVLVRFISLEHCPPDFGNEVTTATNTQNRIDRRDFASLDDTQKRIKEELKLDLNKEYVYKSGDNIHFKDDGCDIEEATIALACAFPDIKLTSIAKRNIGILWDDIYKPPYTQLFNEKLNAVRLWHCVEIYRFVEDILSSEKNKQSGTMKRVAIHGNRFVLHSVFQYLPLDKFDEIDLKMQPIKKLAKEVTFKVVDEIVRIVEQHFKDTYLNSFFKNGTMCSKLESHMTKPPKLPPMDYFETISAENQPSLFRTEG